MSTRVLAGLMAALVLFQGALAGAHLSGQDGALGVHEAMGTVVLTSLGLLTTVVSGLAFRRNRWAFPVTFVALLGLWTQLTSGFADRLDIHLPLGITLFGTYLAIALCAKDRSSSTVKEQ